MYSRFLCLCIILSLTACSSVSSEDVRTSGLYLDVTLIAPSSSELRATARLKVGTEDSNTLVTLGQGEYFLLEEGAQGVQLGAVDSLFGGTYYRGTLAVADTSGLALRLTLVRNGEQPIVTRFAMPQAFIITAPDADTAYSIAADAQVALSWTPTQGTVSVLIESHTDCGEGHKEYYSTLLNSDLGYHTLRVRELVEALLTDPLIDVAQLHCTTTLSLTRRWSQPAAITYSGGEVSASQVRELALQLRP